VFEEHFRPTSSPKIPNDLVWFGHEATWQSLASRRIQFNTASFKAELRYEDSFGIDASVKVGLNGMGVDLGGRFADFQETVWKFEGEYA
jgi:hypothetical protein